MTGLELIAKERERQIERKGFTADHDDEHVDGEMSWAACYYAMPKNMRILDPLEEISPLCFFRETGWNHHWAGRDGKTRIQQLACAGALIAAEIDRLLRREAADVQD